MRRLHAGLLAALGAGVAVAVAVPVTILALPSTAAAAGAPDVITLLSGYDRIWTPSDRTSNPLTGTVHDATAMRRDDELTVWIGAHATAAQRFRALQDSEYQTGGTSYDQSITISTGLGSVLGPLYVAGYQGGRLPLVAALINSTNGSSGAFASTGSAKWYFSHPRPFLPTDPATPADPADAAVCAPAQVNGSSERALRVGRPYAAADGDLEIQRVPDTIDTTHQFSPNDVPLSAGYGSPGICLGGSFPSGHTTTAYEAGITLATLLPELAPEILARASEAGNDRIVLGVHDPLDIMGGRIVGEAAIAARWSDPHYRAQVLEPARAQLVAYLEAQCHGTLAACIGAQVPYTDDPYGGAMMPDGTAQVVTDRASAVATYHERLTYGFARETAAARAPSVPAGAASLLRTAFPGLSDAQRTAVLAQTEIDSGYPLDTTGTAGGSWQRLDLAAAMSATVRIDADGSAHVTSTGGAARVVRDGS